MPPKPRLFRFTLNRKRPADRGYSLPLRQKNKFVLHWQRSEPIIEDVFVMKRGPFIVLEHKFDTHTPSRAGRSD